MDVPTGIVTNLGLATADTGFGAIAHVEVDHGLALCVVDEASQGGTDLNGDGDALDLVVHLIDLETSTVTNLGLASSLYLVLGDRLGAFAVPEASQGGIDLNGDGDAVDQVLYFYDRASTQLRNSQRDLYYTVSTDGRFAAWTVSESAQGQDLDGDGMLNRSILHTYDADADLITNLQLYSANYVVKNDRLVTSAIDLEDLDADGDTTDIVTYVLELAGSSGAIIEDTYASMSSVRRHSMVLTPSESVFGCDFNGDGDLLDVVPALYDFRSGTTRSLGVSSNGGQIWRDAFERMIIVAVDEGGQGGQDLDGDGDATDFVPHVFSRGRLHNTHLASGPNFAIQGNQALFLVREGPNGGMDLNGDGDALDAVFHVLRRCR